MKQQNKEAHPDNAPGDFYVTCDECIACDAPWAEAPDLMGKSYSSKNNNGCFFKRQPETVEEIERACDAVSVSCVEAVRYRGDDPEILKMLKKRRARNSCDVYSNFKSNFQSVNKPQKESVMSGTVTAKKVVAHPYFSMICVLSLFFILPRYGGIAVMVGCASVLSFYVAVLPEQFRSRSGSMMAATCLVVAMWVAAAVITVMILMGEVRV